MQVNSDGKLMTDAEMRAWARGYRVACLSLKNMLLESGSHRELKPLFDELDRMIKTAEFERELSLEQSLGEK